MRKNAANSYRILVEVYGEHALAERTCQKWFEPFKISDCGLEDEERPGQPKKFEGEELEALLDKDFCITQEELAESLGVTQAAISKRLKAAAYIQKKGNWVPHELKSREMLKGVFACLKCCWNATERSHFCIRLLLVIKNESITTNPRPKNHI